jgi:transcriptional regulator with XRE-family HTH domain
MELYHKTSDFRNGDILIRPRFTKLRPLRKQRGLTLVELSSLCLLPQSTLSDIENGKRVDMLGRNLVSLCHALGVDPTYFYEIDLRDSSKKTNKKMRRTI